MDKAPVFLGEGTYGCVYRSPFPCQSKKHYAKTTVGKVFADKSEAAIERRLQNFVSKIDPHQTFSIPVSDICDVSLSNTAFRKELAKCSIINNASKTYQQIVYSNGGLDLRKHMAKKGSKTKFNKIFRLLRPILDGLQVLHKHGYIHQDIKPANMLYNGKKVYLIDFGIMESSKKVYREGNKHVLSHHYPYYPPEYKLYVHGNKPFNTFYLKFIENFSGFPEISGNHVNLIDVMKSTLDMNLVKDLYDVYNSSTSAFKTPTKTDVYSLGIVLLQLYIWSGLEDIAAEKNRNEKIKVLIKGMIKFNPSERLNMDEVIEMHQQILKHK
jgi:serine/threonine protein kinase